MPLRSSMRGRGDEVGDVGAGHVTFTCRLTANQNSTTKKQTNYVTLCNLVLSPPIAWYMPISRLSTVMLVAELFRSPARRLGMTSQKTWHQHNHWQHFVASSRHICSGSLFLTDYLLDINWMSGGHQPVDLAVVPLLRAPKNWLIAWLPTVLNETDTSKRQVVYHNNSVELVYLDDGRSIFKSSLYRVIYLAHL